ncbi:MAG: winged helix-turn-helix domain-containing protein [Candidatus Methanomethyliaceae archaeon]
MGIKGNEEDLFEVLSNPVRVKILEALKDGPLSFSELKKRVGIESSGHLAFHLNKLGKLVEVAEEGGGKYVLTKDGITAIEFASKLIQMKKKNDSKGDICWLVLVVILVVGITGASAFAEWYKSRPTYPVWVSLVVSVTPGEVYLTNDTYLMNANKKPVASFEVLLNGTRLLYREDLRLANGDVLHPAPCSASFSVKKGEVCNFTVIIGFYDGTTVSESRLEYDLGVDLGESAGRGMNFRLEVPLSYADDLFLFPH